MACILNMQAKVRLFKAIQTTSQLGIKFISRAIQYILYIYTGKVTAMRMVGSRKGH